MKKFCKKSKADIIVICVVTLFFGSISGYGFYSQHIWTQRLDSWKTVQGTIIKNERKTTGSGKSRKTVSTIEYRFLYRGNSYSGRKILFDRSTFPLSVKPGSSWKILVDPSDPQNSAAMLRTQGAGVAFARFFSPVLFGIIACFTFWGLRKSVPPALPLELSNYLNSVNRKPDNRKKLVIRADTAPVITAQPSALDHRYTKIAGSGVLNIASVFLLLSTVCFAIPAVLISPVFWILAALHGIVLLLFVQKNRLILIDWQERKIIRCRKFDPGNMKIKKEISFADWDQLYVCIVPFNKTTCLLLSGGKAGEPLHPVFQIGRAKVPMLLKILPELAQKMGNLPVYFRQDTPGFSAK